MVRGNIDSASASLRGTLSGVQVSVLLENVSFCVIATERARRSNPCSGSSTTLFAHRRPLGKLSYLTSDRWRASTPSARRCASTRTRSRQRDSSSTCTQSCCASRSHSSMLASPRCAVSDFYDEDALPKLTPAPTPTDRQDRPAVLPSLVADRHQGGYEDQRDSARERHVLLGGHPRGGSARAELHLRDLLPLRPIPAHRTDARDKGAQGDRTTDLAHATAAERYGGRLDVARGEQSRFRHVKHSLTHFAPTDASRSADADRNRPVQGQLVYQASRLHPFLTLLAFCIE